MFEWIPIADNWPAIRKLSVVEQQNVKFLPALENIDECDKDTENYRKTNAKLCEASIRLTWEDTKIRHANRDLRQTGRWREEYQGHIGQLSDVSTHLWEPQKLHTFPDGMK